MYLHAWCESVFNSVSHDKPVMSISLLLLLDWLFKPILPVIPLESIFSSLSSILLKNKWEMNSDAPHIFFSVSSHTNKPIYWDTLFSFLQLQLSFASQAGIGSQVETGTVHWGPVENFGMIEQRKIKQNDTTGPSPRSGMVHGTMSVLSKMPRPSSRCRIVDLPLEAPCRVTPGPPVHELSWLIRDWRKFFYFLEFRDW